MRVYFTRMILGGFGAVCLLLGAANAATLVHHYNIEGDAAGTLVDSIGKCGLRLR